MTVIYHTSLRKIIGSRQNRNIIYGPPLLRQLIYFKYGRYLLYVVPAGSSTGALSAGTSDTGLTAYPYFSVAGPCVYV